MRPTFREEARAARRGPCHDDRAPPASFAPRKFIRFRAKGARSAPHQLRTFRRYKEAGATSKARQRRGTKARQDHQPVVCLWAPNNAAMSASLPRLLLLLAWLQSVSAQGYYAAVRLFLLLVVLLGRVRAWLVCAAGGCIPDTRFRR